MSATTDGGKDACLRGGSDGALHIAHIQATGNKAGPAIGHAVPNRSRLLVAAVARAQQVTFKSLTERRVELLAGFHHWVSLNVLCISQTQNPPRRHGERQRSENKIYSAGFNRHLRLCGTGTLACAQSPSEGREHRQEYLCHKSLGVPRNQRPGIALNHMLPGRRLTRYT